MCRDRAAPVVAEAAAVAEAEATAAAAVIADNPKNQKNHGDGPRGFLIQKNHEVRPHGFPNLCKNDRQPKCSFKARKLSALMTCSMRHASVSAVV